jgi:hypothetical protein
VHWSELRAVVRYIRYLANVKLRIRSTGTK